MAELITREQLAQTADIHARMPSTPTVVDRTFELPIALYVASVGLFLGFIALMAVGFAHREVIIPFGISVIFVVGFFGLPTAWTRLAPRTRSRAISWGMFRQEGIMTACGRVSARDAAVQVLILPVLIFLWGVVAVTIAALV